MRILAFILWIASILAIPYTHNSLMILADLLLWGVSVFVYYKSVDKYEEY